VIKSTEALDNGHIKVELKDGRVQEIRILNLNNDSDISVSITETKDGKVIREESTLQNKN
jgi:hypothetical protein